jgi:outer membrane protein OmpA-like peptidoglycan-associated protein
LEDIADLIFSIRDLDVELANDNTLSFTGGIIENEKSAFSEAITHYMSTLKIKKKNFITSFSLVLELEKEAVKKVPSKTKELIFENENQAILSCDQLRTLQDWWAKLNPDLKLKIENRKAHIKIIGYTTTTGSDLYNFKLGKDRAFDVGNLLASMIGRDLEGKSIADIRPITQGEKSNDPNRYVKILVVQ